MGRLTKDTVKFIKQVLLEVERDSLEKAHQYNKDDEPILEKHFLNVRKKAEQAIQEMKGLQ